MILKPIAECDRDLNFFPRLPWPQVMPPLAWRGKLVSGFERGEGLVLDLCDEQQVEAVLLAAHPQLNVFECARLCSLKLDNCTLDFALLCKPHQWSENLKLSLASMARLPLPFQHWCEVKGLSARDVQILRNFDDLAPLASTCQFLMQVQATKSQAVEILEMVGELLLLGGTPEELAPGPIPPDGWLSELRKRRQPRANTALQERNRALTKLPWPRATSGRWQRRHDALELEVTIKARDAQELDRRLKELELLTKGMQ